jgi:hypothetical protein
VGATGVSDFSGRDEGFDDEAVCFIVITVCFEQPAAQGHGEEGITRIAFPFGESSRR